MVIKKILAATLATTLLLTTVQVYAANEKEVTGDSEVTGESKVTLEVKDNSGGGTDPDIIIVTVPTELPIVMDLEGTVTVPTTANIINHVESKAIKVTNLEVVLKNGWVAANYTDDFTAKAQDTKEINIAFRGDKLISSGEFSLSSGNWEIGADSTLPLNMEAKLPKQSASSKSDIATVNFTFDWAN